MKKLKILSCDKAVTFILGGGINGLGIVRGLAENKIPCVVIDTDKDISFFSRHTCGLICPNPVTNESEFVKFLIELGKKLKTRGLIWPTNDSYLKLISKNIKFLGRWFVLPILPWDHLKVMLNKNLLYQFAARNEIPHPETIRFANVEKIFVSDISIKYPIIIKPAETIGFKAAVGEKVLIAKTIEDLEYYIEKIKISEFVDKPILLQEYVPGDIDALYTFTSYADKNSNVICYSIGHKIRQSPPETGTIISGRVVHIEEILKIGCHFIKAAKFIGVSNIEFKRDSNSGQYKLIEINPRSGIWNYSSTANGVNIPFITYMDVIENTSLESCNQKKEIVWFISILDFFLSVIGFKKKGYKSYHLTLNKWLYSVKGKKVDAVFKLNDPGPFVCYLLILLKKILNLHE